MTEPMKNQVVPTAAAQRQQIAECREIAKMRRAQLAEAAVELEKYERVIEAWDADVSAKGGE